MWTDVRNIVLALANGPTYCEEYACMNLSMSSEQIHNTAEVEDEIILLGKMYNATSVLHLYTLVFHISACSTVWTDVRNIVLALGLLYIVQSIVNCANF